MSVFIQLVFSLLLFALALRLSAFFSGTETGFYRASFLRITIDAQAGDPTAQRLLWFARNPNAFVTTILLFGAAMVMIMVWRPQGLFARREPTALLHPAGGAP